MIVIVIILLLPQLRENSDYILQNLAGMDNLIGEFVSHYIKERSNYSWIYDYLKNRAKYYLLNTGKRETHSQSIPSLLIDNINHRQTIGDDVVLKSILPHYFRGFRVNNKKIDLNSKLIVVDGKNSQGKTSLVEAIEWLFTGDLSRRGSKNLGDSKELENCISNSFKPMDEVTWVEAELVKKQEIINLKRILIKDYGKSRNDICSSKLFKNNIELSEKQESELMEQLFGSVPPILMQHTLGEFVKSNPSERYKYFESLLNLDGLTTLIEKSTISEESLDMLKTSNDFFVYQKFESIVNKKSNYLNRYKDTNPEEKENFITKILIDIAKKQCGESTTESPLNDYYKLIKNEMIDKKKEIFSSYHRIKPNQISEHLYQDIVNKYHNPQWIEQMKNAHVISHGKDEGQPIHVLTILREFLLKLKEMDFLDFSKELQPCPLCNHSEKPTLSLDRINEIISTSNLSTLLDVEQEQDFILKELRENFITIFNISKSFLPFDENIESNYNVDTEDPKIYELVALLKNLYTNLHDTMTKIEHKNFDIFSLSNNLYHTDISKLGEFVRLQCDNYVQFINLSKKYLNLFSQIEDALDLSLNEDNKYTKSRDWIFCVENIVLLKSELDWVISKKLAQQELKMIREKLIEVRQDILEAKRKDFNNEISNTWSVLRGDRYSKFQSLNIPKSRGKGFPVEIKVMATIDDGSITKEIDALRIFSESQINALGISAFITRSKILGHKMIIFDDPVQSMDEDHYKTFASGVIKDLLNFNFQVIVFTHSDHFAREISYAYWDYDHYTTMQIRHLRKRGCQIEEGNRRVSERLRTATRLSDEGNFSDAWKYIRLAIERMYILINLKYVDKFDPFKWSDQTAEYMWNQSTAQIIEKYKPEMKNRLKSILAMSASGSHDKSSHGETDIINSIKDINSTMSSLDLSD